jgi:hypothetical protein
LIYAARRVKRYSASSPLDIDLSAGRSHIDDAYREAGARLYRIVCATDRANGKRKAGS